MSDFVDKRKIASLPGVAHDAKTVLLRTLEKLEAGEIESVYIGIQWTRDRGFDADWSKMLTGTLAMHAMQALDNATQAGKRSG